MQQSKFRYYVILILIFTGLSMAVDAYLASRFDPYASLIGLVIDLPLSIVLITTSFLVRRREKKNAKVKNIITISGLVVGFLLLIWRTVLVGLA